MAVCVLMQRFGGCLSDPPSLSCLPVGHGWMTSMTHLSLSERLALQSKEPALVTWGASPSTLSPYQRKEGRGGGAHFRCPGGRERRAAERLFFFSLLWIHLNSQRKCSFHESISFAFVTCKRCSAENKKEEHEKCRPCSVELQPANQYDLINDFSEDSNGFQWPGVDSPLSIWSQNPNKREKTRMMHSRASYETYMYTVVALMGTLFPFGIREHFFKMVVSITVVVVSRLFQPIFLFIINLDLFFNSIQFWKSQQGILYSTIL